MLPRPLWAVISMIKRLLSFNIMIAYRNNIYPWGGKYHKISPQNLGDLKTAIVQYHDHTHVPLTWQIMKDLGTKPDLTFK